MMMHPPNHPRLHLVEGLPLARRQHLRPRRRRTHRLVLLSAQVPLRRATRRRKILSVLPPLLQQQVRADFRLAPQRRRKVEEHQYPDSHLARHLLLRHQRLRRRTKALPQSHRARKPCLRSAKALHHCRSLLETAPIHLHLWERLRSHLVLPLQRHQRQERMMVLLHLPASPSSPLEVAPHQPSPRKALPRQRLPRQCLGHLRFRPQRRRLQQTIL
mmetsp:Transcript_205/g.398  ORF Transcript_205/g.398 Transcript_205/m.398 type:complete len:216 (-) Transcript_205:763-1410(-)